MSKKSLIAYSSWTGNTEKVALRFKKVFEARGWECDVFKIDRKTDAANPPFNFENYDFVCIGSPIMLGLPDLKILELLTKSPLSGHYGQPSIEEFVDLMRKNPKTLPHPSPEKIKEMEKKHPDGKIVPGPKSGVVFVTYGGIHLGPKEAAPSLSFLENELEHLRFKCAGSFGCPGKHGNRATPEWWHGDIRNRPSERDLLRAELFLEEKLDECRI